MMISNLNMYQGAGLSLLSNNNVVHATKNKSIGPMGRNAEDA